MKRKLVRQGQTTLMISIPQRWSKRFGLSKGSEINLDERGNYLMISPEDKISTTQINVTKNSETAIRIAILNTYRQGYDSIKVVFKDESQYELICKVVQDYILGLEAARTSKNSCLLESISEPSAEQFEPMFRKIFLNALLMIKKTNERLSRDTPFSDYEQVMLRIHKLDNYCRRSISKQRMLTEKAEYYFGFLSHFTHCPRELYHLNRFLDKNKVNIKRIPLAEMLVSSFSLLEDAYLKKDLSKIEQIHEFNKGLFSRLYQLLEKNSKENAVIFHLGAALRNLCLASSPLVGIISER